MDAINVPAEPLPSLNVANAFNALRLDVVKLLALQKQKSEKVAKLASLCPPQSAATVTSSASATSRPAPSRTPTPSQAAVDAGEASNSELSYRRTPDLVSPVGDAHTPVPSLTGDNELSSTDVDPASANAKKRKAPTSMSSNASKNKKKKRH